VSISAAQLIAELATVVDAVFAQAAVESYVEMQQRFLQATGNLPNLMEAASAKRVSRALYQLDTGLVTHSDLPGTLCDLLEDFRKKASHKLAEGDRRHFLQSHPSRL